MTFVELPTRFNVVIDGHQYQIDPASYRRRSLPVMRQQSDQTPEPGEQSLNPHGLWRRTQDSWHHGAGQEFLDGRIDGTLADPERFRLSYGVDVWERGQLSLLPLVEQVHSSAHFVIAVGDHAYAIDGTGAGSQVRWRQSPTVGSVWSSAAIHGADAAETIHTLTTDGTNIWAAIGTSGIHRTTRAATSSTANVPAAPAGGTITLVAKVLDRLLAAGSSTSASQRNVLWEVTSPLTAPALSVLKTHDNTGFMWLGAAPGRNVIYAWGNTPAGPDNLNLALPSGHGGRAEVYRIGINSDGSLGTPIMATHLPNGESIHAVLFYAGVIVLGTSRGVRVGVADAQGNIDYGPLIETLYPVTCLEGQDRYVWFGMPEQDHGAGASSARGLGRIDLGYQVSSLVPAWAQDVYTEALDLANVTSVASLAGGAGYNLSNLVFAVSGGSGVGIYRPNPSGKKQLRGRLHSGRIRWSTTEQKTIHRLDVATRPIPGTAPNQPWIEPYVIADEDTTLTLTTISMVGSTFSTQLVSGNDGFPSASQAEVYFELERGPVDTNESPVVTRYTLKALPTPARNEQFMFRLLLKPVVATSEGDGGAVPIDVPVEVAFLKTLEQSGEIVQFQVGNEAFWGYVEESQFEGEHWYDQPQEGWGHERSIAGVMDVILTTVNG